MGIGNWAIVAWGLGIRLLWHGDWELVCYGMGTGNWAIVAWGLGISLLWHGDWESGYCGMGTGNHQSIVVRIRLFSAITLLVYISSG